MSTDPSADVSLLAVGMQVRAVDSEPVFSSDPKSGDVGEVIEASPPSYLVRWQSTAETWMQRANLESLGGGDPEPAETAEPAKPVPATPSRARYFMRYGGIIVFGLLTARGWIPALKDAVSHPTLRSVIVVALVLGGVVVAIVLARRRAALVRQARADQAAADAASRPSGDEAMAGIENERETPSP